MVLALIPVLAATLAAANPAETASASDGIRFVDTADAWAVGFHHRHGGQGEFYMIETLGSGVAAFDYDGDGDDDLLFVDSGEPSPHGRKPGRTTLLRNDGGRFVDVTEASGVQLDSYGMGAVTGDVDGDGDPDLYLTAFGPNRLFVNEGDGTFTAAQQETGAADPSWSTSAALGDVDLDGDLDLYVANYVDFSHDNNVACGRPESGLRSYCHPDVYNGLADRFYRNEHRRGGDPLFVDATAEFGLGEARSAGLGVVITDLNDDRRPDIYVANDMDPNLHFLNRSTGNGLRFADDALLAGTALSRRGEAEAGMGIAVGDIDGNGFEDLVVTHLDKQTNALYSNQGNGLFLEHRFVAGIAEPSLPWVGFGVALADFDLDGDLDLVIANGHVIHDISAREPRNDALGAQPNQLLENRGGRFTEIEDSGLSGNRVSRGLAVADFDLDGDPDLVISNCNQRAEVYRNESTRKGEAVQVDLLDRESANPRAIGAVLEVRSRTAVQRRGIRAGSSYLSQSSTTRTFGIAPSANEADDPETVELRVQWPGQGSLQLPGLPIGRRLRVVR